ncbi:hypothetical protein D3C81_2158880 [compost metagenome]
MYTVGTLRWNNSSVFGLCISKCTHSYWPICRRETGISNHQILRLASSRVKWQLLTPSTAPPSSLLRRAMARGLSSFIRFLQV